MRRRIRLVQVSFHHHCTGINIKGFVQLALNGFNVMNDVHKIDCEVLRASKHSLCLFSILY